MCCGEECEYKETCCTHKVCKGFGKLLRLVGEADETINALLGVGSKSETHVPLMA